MKAWSKKGAFGRAKRTNKKPEEQPQPTAQDIVEIPEEDMVDNNPLALPNQQVQQPVQPVVQPQVQQQPQQQQFQQQPQQQQFQQQPQQQQFQQPVQVAGTAKIIEGQLLENGLIRYTLIANKSLGNIGDELPID